MQQKGGLDHSLDFTGSILEQSIRGRPLNNIKPGSYNPGDAHSRTTSECPLMRSLNPQTFCFVALGRQVEPGGLPL